MLAYTYIEKGKFALVEKPKPTMIEPTDAIVRITMSSICTSDLHIKHGSVPRAVLGIIVGHEMVGVVEEIGSEVTNVRPGDRVTVNVETFCGECFFCKNGYVNNCTDPNGGWALGCRIDGGQTEYLRVPLANQGLNRIPDSVTDEQALLVGDVLATGFCIVSSDSDFTRLAVRLRESGRLVIGMGEKKTPNPFIVSCDKFIYIEILNQPTQSTSSIVAVPKINSKEKDVPKSTISTNSSNASSVPFEIIELIIQSISDLSDESGWAFLADIGNLIIKKQPDFDSRNYGFQKLTQLLESFIDKFEIEKRDTSNPHIKHIYVRNKL